jgi:hypothetical protein
MPRLFFGNNSYSQPFAVNPPPCQPFSAHVSCFVGKGLVVVSYSQCYHLTGLVQDVAPASGDVLLHILVMVLSEGTAGRWDKRQAEQRLRACMNTHKGRTIVL